MTATISRYQFTADQTERMRALGIAATPDGRFTADAYLRIAAAGIFAADDRIELIAGEIIEMPGPDFPHANAVRRLTRVLTDRRLPGFAVDVQNPLRLSTDGVPLPDLAVIYDRDYTALPTEADVLLVIEVSDTTVRDDRRVKLPLYAAAGVPEAWLVGLKAGIIERHTAPHDGRYTQTVQGGAGDTLSSTTVPSLVIPIADVLR